MVVGVKVNAVPLAALIVPQVAPTLAVAVNGVSKINWTLQKVAELFPIAWAVPELFSTLKVRYLLLQAGSIPVTAIVPRTNAPDTKAVVGVIVKVGEHAVVAVTP